jgi:hypothetical protein
MPAVPSRQPLETKGWSPKSQLATFVPLGVALALLLLDKLVLDDSLDDSLWLGLLLGGPVAGLAAYQAKPGDVRIARGAARKVYAGEAGLAAVEAIVVGIVLILIAAAVFVLVGR